MDDADDLACTWRVDHPSRTIRDPDMADRARRITRDPEEQQVPGLESGTDRQVCRYRSLQCCRPRKSRGVMLDCPVASSTAVWNRR